MWYLQNTMDAALRFPLVTCKDMVVGRKECDILLPGDQSISRRHATVYVTEDRRTGVVTLTDCKAKFGTAVNSKKLGASQKIKLHHNDVIAFGQGSTAVRSKFKLIHEPLVFCCSAMTKSESSKVKQLAKTLGAEVESGWSERCSHLVMSGITVTVKVVCALSSCKPVVTSDWLTEAICCRQSSLPLPSPSSFQPKVVDANIINTADGAAVSFAPNYSRTGLFQDRVFYFLSEKQYSRLKSCLLNTGASCQLFSSPDSLALETLGKEQSVVLAVDSDVMNQATPTEKQWAQRVYNFLASRDLRAVQDSEIGFALLYISSEEYCNPRATPSLPMSSTPMAPPTLSQAPFTQPHSSHQHSLTLTHTLPYTQDVNTQTTILAPDTVDQSQPQKANTRQSPATGGSIQKINETIASVKSSLDKGPSLDKSSVNINEVKTERVDESRSAIDEGVPSQIGISASVNDKSPLRKGKSPESRDKHPPHEAGSSTATAAVHSVVQTFNTIRNENTTVKNEPLDSLFGDVDDGAAGPGIEFGTSGERERVVGERERGEEGEKRERGEEGGRRQGVKRQRQEIGGEVGSYSQTLPSSQRNRLKLMSPRRTKMVQSVTEEKEGVQESRRLRAELRDEVGDGQERQSSSIATPMMLETPMVDISQSEREGGEISEPGPYNPKSKKQCLDTSSQRYGPQVLDTANTNPKPTPSQSSVALPSPSQLEGSVIVPCSLTPRTQDNANKGDRSLLPNSELLASVFRGKRKKRPHTGTSATDAVSEATESSKKKQRVCEEEGERDSRGKSSSVAHREGATTEVREEKKRGTENGDQGKALAKTSTNGVCGEANGDTAGLFSEVRSEQTRKGKDSTPLAGKPYVMEGLPLLETREDAVYKNVQQRIPGQGTVAEKPISGEALTDVQTPQEALDGVQTRKLHHRDQDSSNGRLLAPNPDRSPPPSTQRHPPPPTPDPLMFLSTRKKRRSPRDSTATPTTPLRATSSRVTSPFKLYTQHTSTTQTACPLSTQRTGACLATPFTSLVTGGRRMKACDRENTTALWDDDDKGQLDVEDPLVDDSNEDAPKKVYKPVCDEDGFVCSRIKPRVQTSRASRLAAFAGTDNSQYSSYSESGGVEGTEGTGVGGPVAEIVYTKLVVVAARRGRGRGRGREEETDGGVRPQNGVRNFKKFQKVQHIGAGAIPRLVSLTEYVPPTSRELQDWMEDLENAAEEGPEQESSQDLFRFPTSRRRT